MRAPVSAIDFEPQGRIEQSFRQFNAANLQYFSKTWPHSGCTEIAGYFAVGSDTGLAEGKNFLHRDDVTFHASDFLDADNLAFAVRQAGDLHDDSQCRTDLMPRNLGLQVHAGQPNHVFEAGQCIAWGVGMDGYQRTFMAGIHRLQHIDGFFTAHLAQDDAIRAHPQRVAHQCALRNFARTFDVWRARFQAHHMRLLQL